MPLSSRCALCQVPFDFYGHTETMTEDFGHVVRSKGLQRYFQGADDSITSRANPTLFRRRSEDERGLTTRGMRMFSTLTREQRQGIYELYKMDFEIFGYSRVLYM